MTYRSWYRRRPEGSHASGDAELSKTPLQRVGAGSTPAEVIGRAVYAIPRAELYMKTANFQETKRSTRTRHVCIHVAHSRVCVLLWALSGAS